MDQPHSNPDAANDVAEPQNLTLVQRITGVFFSPGSTFAQIDRKPDWLIPMLILVVTAVVFTYFTLPITLPEQLAKQEQIMEEQGASGEQINQARAMGERIGKIFGLIAAVVFPGVFTLLFALIFWFVGNVVLGGQTTYLKMLSVLAYTSLIGVLDMLIKLPLILVKKTADIGLNLAVLLPESLTDTLLADIMKVMDIFVLWRFAVLAIAFTVLYKFTLEKAAWTMVVLFVIVGAIQVGFMQLPGQ